jgi:hypothetical protein
MRWSPEGRFAYLDAATAPADDGPGARGKIGLDVLAWDDSSRTLSFTQFLTFKLAYGPNEGQPSLTIDHGALYTKDANVTLSFRPAPHTQSFRIANDPAKLDDGPARRVDADGDYAWRLATGAGAPRDVRHVHVRVWTYANEPIDVSDDVVLDQHPPVITSAVVEDGQLRLRARDNRSGVRRMQVTRDRSKPGPRRPFAKKLPVARYGRVWVRVFDGAKNRSHWRAAERG